MKIRGFMKFFIVTLLALLLTPLSIQALPIDVGFQRITNNNVENVAGQLGLQIMDSADALSAFGETIDDDQILMIFTNNVGITSSISEIYIDDGTIFARSEVLNSLGGFTEFTNGSANTVIYHLGKT